MQTLQMATRNIYQTKIGPKWLTAKGYGHSIGRKVEHAECKLYAAFSCHDTPYKQITTKTLPGIISQFALCMYSNSG